MFPFEGGEEFSSQISHYPQLENIQEEDVMLDLQVDRRNLTKLVGEGLQPNQTFGASNSSGNSSALLSNVEKKIFRKEIERQRRQQMSTLLASLRSLLPLELTKGKRSMSDHLDGAVNYIQYLKNNVRELSVKRDKLKRLSNSASSCEDQATKTSENKHVSVRTYMNGAEIIITSDYGEESFVLSRSLEALLEEGFDVCNCFSTRKDGRLFAIILCQVSSDAASTDEARLQQKLSNVISCLKDNAKK